MEARPFQGPRKVASFGSPSSLVSASPAAGPGARRSQLRPLARILTIALVVLITFGAFYVAFAQTAGTYSDPSCSLATASFQQHGTAYVSYFVPGVTGNTVGYYARIISGTSSLTDLVPGFYTGQSATASCQAYALISSGTFTAVIIVSTASPTPGGTSTETSAVFTALPIYIVNVYGDSACSATSTSSFAKGSTAYIQFEMPGANTGSAEIAQVANSTTTDQVTSRTDLVSLSTCYPYVASANGVFTGAILVVINTTPAITSVSAFNEFTVGSGAVPDLPFGIFPMLLTVILAYLMLVARSKAKRNPGHE
ncbi:MAG: hypothetical protein KGI26_03910 [Thaumarchaeota archaeon]|nr:hypothetical protein [Nitrososphaerota archaeon]